MFDIKKGEIFVPFKLPKLPLSQKMSNSHDSYTPFAIQSIFLEKPAVWKSYLKRNDFHVHLFSKAKKIVFHE